MISKWKVQNFKSINQETELDFGPLTIFSGANSSGKSTFIQSILLIAQTLAHKVSSRSVVLNGALTSLGQFDDLKSNNSDSDEISIQFTCKPLQNEENTQYWRHKMEQNSSMYFRGYPNKITEVSCEVIFGADLSDPQRELLQVQPRLITTQLSCMARDEDNIDQKVNISVHHSNKAISDVTEITGTSEMNDHLRAALMYWPELDDKSISDAKEHFCSAKPIGCNLKHFLPEKILYSINFTEEEARDITKSLQHNIQNKKRLSQRHKKFFLSQDILEILQNVLKSVGNLDEIFKIETSQRSPFDPESNGLTLGEWNKRLENLHPFQASQIYQILCEHENLFSMIYEAINKTMPAEQQNFTFFEATPSYVIAESISFLETLFASSLKYLGPLRDTPKPLYPLVPAADPNDVGLRGEHTASMLELHKDKKIKYIPSLNFQSHNVNRKIITRTLKSAVIDWLQYLGVADSVTTKDQGKLGHELKVSLANSSIEHDLTHVGVGVSQVLPILVMCLLADEDSTLIFEQPELHLHPKVQTLLGDFFLSMALCNKQCVIETHSEYLIDRIRFRIAAAHHENDLTNQAKIYFVEKTTQNSTFREVNINEYGAIPDWPEGFFDQSQREAEEILRAAARKRKANRKSKDE